MVNMSFDVLDEAVMSSVLLMDYAKYKRCLSPLQYAEKLLTPTQVLVIRCNADGTLSGRIFVADDYYYWSPAHTSIVSFQEGFTLIQNI